MSHYPEQNQRIHLQMNLEQQIHSDLAPLGKIYDIRGVIEDTDQGVWFQDVTVTVSVAPWRELLRVHVGWDPENTELTYRNADGKHITLDPAPPGFATPGVFERLSAFNDKVVTNGNRNQWTDDTKHCKKNWLTTLGVFGVAVLLGVGLAFGWGIPLTQWIATGAAGAFAVFTLYVLTRGPRWFVRHTVDDPFASHEDVDWDSLLPEEWNGHPMEVFDALFVTDAERTTFLTELQEHASRSGVAFDDFTRVSSVCRRDGGGSANRSTPDSQMRVPLIEFTGTVNRNPSPSVCYWDGTRIYYTVGGTEVFPA